MNKSLRFFIESEQHKEYEDITKKSSSFLQGKRFADVFLLSCLLGYKRGKYEEQKKRREVAAISVFSEEELWILRGLAFVHRLNETGNEEEALRVLLDDSMVFKIVEGYAKSGLKHLKYIIELGLRESIEDKVLDILEEICSDETINKYIECD